MFKLLKSHVGYYSSNCCLLSRLRGTVNQLVMMIGVLVLHLH
jgi:hypothetical protein